ncbi:hypothetical protein [Nocardia huaxiensis]|uniref:Beta-lactamase class A n=1 Tax=Nocardia huaxiensis TaxID=2755382 RepID=A0A7D6V8B1_9NOCA|nr:hypothetical protein [Nocardia huaxiensis]QLY30021.1 hypothetical protein H0264_33305 [Nocardia huaxiensis]UFS96385.1 hypothetical protein LPY97_00085 [Nocardia huaxiensis]
MSTDPIPACRKAIARCVAVATLFAVSACGLDSGTPGTPAPDPNGIVPVAEGNGIAMLAPNLPDLLDLPKTVNFATDFADLQASIDGRIGLAVMPVGGGDITQFGDWTTGIAWSTIKVPIALAALRNDPTGMRSLAEAAITYSDNGAAQTLWNSLGSDGEAADIVQQVLHEAGDDNTDIGGRHTQLAQLGSDELIAFGATNWTLSDQVRFAAKLPCMPRANSVVSLMSEITHDQSWGLGRLIGAEFKGGWGPDDDTGFYTVRQFGLVPTLSGPVAVAMAAEPASGSFEDATDIMDRMALLLADHLQDLRGGDCS